MVTGTISTILFIIFVTVIGITAINAFIVLIARLLVCIDFRHKVEAKRFYYRKFLWKIDDKIIEEIKEEIKESNSKGSN